jgi:hypothetical protein
MNTTRQAPFFAPPQDLWGVPDGWARSLVRRVFEPRRAARPIESTVSLNRGATTWVVKPHGRQVTCESGALWLCFDGEPVDIVLAPGQTHRCAKRSALSIHALSRSVVGLA